MTPSTFTFLSALVGLPVVDAATGRRIGTVDDLSAELREMYPKASGLVVSAGWRKGRATVPWKDVQKILDGDRVLVATPPLEFSPRPALAPNEILLKEAFWDKQIVDISGSKVVRVNDLHLLREEPNIWLVHMDVGITGLFRRLGCQRWAQALFRLFFGVSMKDRLISWKFVQPVAAGVGGDALALKVHHSKLSELHPADLAEIFTDLGHDEREAVLHALDTPTRAKLFQELPMKVRVQTADLIEPDGLRDIVEAMATDEAVDFVAQAPRAMRDTLLPSLSPEKAGQIGRLLELSHRVAGSIMNTEFIAVAPDASAREILERMRAAAPRKESIYHAYVEDARGLIGVVTLRQLLTVDPSHPASKFMYKRPVSIGLDESIQEVAELFVKYDFTVLPVVDAKDRVQGIVAIKDAFLAVSPDLRALEEASQ
ncbi:MAG: CBS domain-containing protein [Elusimicrobiota bacterium]